MALRIRFILISTGNNQVSLIFLSLKFLGNPILYRKGVSGVCCFTVFIYFSCDFVVFAAFRAVFVRFCGFNLLTICVFPPKSGAVFRFLVILSCGFAVSIVFKHPRSLKCQEKCRNGADTLRAFLSFQPTYDLLGKNNEIQIR